ncbi:MAG: PEP-CTERM sorting domain-containing protein [Planctomycetota bacterium]
MTRLLVTMFCLMAMPITAANASIVVFDFSTGGAAGAALDGTNGASFTDVGSGVTIQVDTTTSFATGTGSVFNAIGSGAGVDTTGVTSGGGDEASQIDVEETLKFTLTFTGVATLQEIDFSSFGSAGEELTADVAGTLFTLGTADVDGDQDWNANGGLSISSGDMITLSANVGEYRLGSLTLDVTAIPEPASLMMFGSAMLLGIRRRR